MEILLLGTYKPALGVLWGLLRNGLGFPQSG